MNKLIKKINISDPYKNYNIVIGNSIIENVSEYIDFTKYSKIILLTEEKIFNLWGNYFLNSVKIKSEVIKIGSGESEKNLINVEKILNYMLNLKLDRTSLLINLGGGMISDLGGLVASLYMRGIDFVNIPTTLLAMVDASMGGKVAVNLNNMKNMVGLFNSPSYVFIDTKFLETLPYRETVSANAEIIKHGIICDKKFFNFILNNGIDVFKKDELIEIIEQSSSIKKDIVEKDFKEQNIRRSLNFGHTVGHAFETLSMQLNNPLLHGEAVAIGMIIEAKISNLMNIINDEDFKLIYSAILYNGFNDIVKSKFDFLLKDVIDIIYIDKKNECGKIYMAIPESIGKCISKIEVSREIIEQAIVDFFEKRDSYH